MTLSAGAGKKNRRSNKTNEQTVVEALRKLPPDSLPEVLRYIEFLDYKISSARADAEEETALWAAVEANREYKRQHPDEGLEIHDTGADFLRAVADV